MKILKILTLLAFVGVGAVALPTVAADSEPTETQFLTQVRQLTFDGRRAGEGYYSPDGRKLVFQSERDPANPFYQIFELDLETGETRQVSPGMGKTTCSFIRPGDGAVLFSSTHHDPESARLQREELELRTSGKERRYAWDYDPEMELYVQDPNTRKLTRLTDARGYDAEGSYSPDGEWIVFASNRAAFSRKLNAQEQKKMQVDPAAFNDLYVMKADGSGLRQITDTMGYDGGPFFAPDGEHIIWRRFDESGLTADVWMARMDGSAAHRLTDFKSMSWAPYVHPSGDYAIFTTNKLGFDNFELYIVDVAGEREPVRVTYTDGFDGLPVPTPDGQGLTWTTNRKGGQSQLFTGRWNHEAALAALAASPRTGPGATGRAHGVDSIEDQVAYLASDELGGRMTGTPGARAAAEYIAAQLREIGVKPLPGHDGFLHPFEFTAGMNDGGSSLTLRLDGREPVEQSGDATIRALSFSDTAQVTAPVVFAGYGLKLPDDSGFPYDSFATLDLEGKVALVLRYFPEGVDQETRSVLSRYSGLRYKAMQARERGAIALLVVTGPNSPNAGETVAMTFDTALSGSGIVAASISGEIAAALFAAVPDTTLESVQSALDTGNPHVTGFDLPGVEMTLDVKVLREQRTGNDVLGYLPANDENPAAEYVGVGAHFDHLGLGGHGNSLAGKDDAGGIHHGADDNASGVAVALQVAKALSSVKRNRPVLFGFWTGEELGLLGSTHFAKSLEGSDVSLAAYLNLDMVGRLRDDKLSVQSAGSSPIWGRLIEQSNVPVGLDVNVQEDPYLPTDSAAFYTNGIATLNLFTGSHEDYHRPSDTADKLNYAGMERIAKFASLLATKMSRLEETPAYVAVERRAGEGGDRDSLRAYTGTIPDYTAEAKGLLLSGVVGGGPAEEAGLAGGDVIVMFAGQEITNIYDYTYALDAVKIDQPIRVVFERDGERKEVTMTPRARK